MTSMKLVGLQFAGLLLLALAACSGGPPAATPPPPAASATPSAPEVATPTDADLEPAFTPVACQFSDAIQTYRDPEAGFAFDLPASWHLVEVSEAIRRQGMAFAVTASSWTPSGAGSEGIPPGGAKLDITVIRTDASNLEEAALERSAQMQSQEPAEQILREEHWLLAGDLQAIRWQVESRGKEVLMVLTFIEGKTILLTGLGDLAQVDQVACTLRALRAVES